uniref:tigger transposable element-derived protein 1-like n=1 Tax=Myxine glutinosa TaxID=7769 RepID=UPI00358ECFDF
MADIPRPPTIAQRNAAAPAREIKKRKNLTYAQKCEIVQLIDNGETKRSVGKKFGINESTVRGIYQNRDHIKAHMNLASSEAGAQAMRSRNQLLLKPEQLLGRYLERQAKRNLAIDTREIMDTAKDIYAAVARKMGVQQPPVFLASKGWVDKFMSRHKVKSVKISGEAASGDKSAAREYPESLKNIIDEGQSTPDQIFNMDETNFYWKAMPRRTFITTKSAKVRGRKAIKERFTLLFAMDASGTCRLKPTVVHRAKRPRAYKGCNMNKLNVHWLTSKKGYMSAKLSQDWLKEAFIPEVEDFCKSQNIRLNILLLLDNAPGHSPLLRAEHPNVKVEFLPPNTTSLIQPLDQEVISVVKASYSTRQFRKMRQATKDTAVIQQLLDSEDEDDMVQWDTEAEQKVIRYWKNYNVKQAIDLMVDCWNNVTPATINHAWRNILEGLPEDRQVAVPGTPQTVEAEVEAAAEEARQIPGAGFAETTGEDIREMIQPAAVTVDEIIEEDDVEQEEDSSGEDEEGVNVRREGLSMADIKKMIDLGCQLRHLLEQDLTINSEARMMLKI